MYLNFFARKWCTNEFEDLFTAIRGEYEIYALTLQHDKIYFPTFKERFITHVIVSCGNNYMSFAINNKMNKFMYNVFATQFYDFKKKNPTTLAHEPIQETMKSEVEATLGIDNNVNQDKKRKITFCLNDYTSTEREKIIAFLANVDGNSPEVYIDIDLSSCSKEQAENLSNTLLCASVVNND